MPDSDGLPSKQDDKDSSAGAVAIPSPPKRPKIFQDIDYIKELDEKNLSKTQLTTLLYSAHALKSEQETRAAVLDAKLEATNLDVSKYRERCRVLEASIQPLTLINAILVVIGTVMLSSWTVPKAEWAQWTLFGAGIMANAGVIITILTSAKKD